LHGLLPSQVLLPVLQMSIMGMGMFISYSRIYDNMHHWSDVLVGMTVGVFMATLIVRIRKTIVGNTWAEAYI
jgi:phosphatidate phosphatase